MSARDAMLDAEGNQLDLFNFTVEEKIGLKDYSNVVVRASLSRYVPDTDEARKEVVDLVETIASNERNVILESLGIEVN